MKPDRDRDPLEVAFAGFNAIREIDQTDQAHEDALLAAFLCAAWPSVRAQNQ
jgi:hypothetical protein